MIKQKICAMTETIIDILYDVIVDEVDEITSYIERKVALYFGSNITVNIILREFGVIYIYIYVFIYCPINNR